MQTGLGSRSSNCNKRLSLTAKKQPYFAKLKSTSFQVWLLASKQKMMNPVSKVRLRLILSTNEARGKMWQKSSARLVKRRKDLFNKLCLNIWRAVNARWGAVGLSTRRSNKTAGNPRTEAGTRQVNKVVKVLEQAEWNNKEVRNPRQNHKGAGEWAQKTSIKQDIKKAAEPATRACIEAKRLSSCASFLAARLFCFLTFSSSESVIG